MTGTCRGAERAGGAAPGRLSRRPVRPRPAARGRGIRRGHPYPGLDPAGPDRRSGARPASAATSPRCRGFAGSAICRPPGSMAIAAAAGSMRAPHCAERRARPAPGRSPRRAGSICGVGRGVPVHIFRLAAIYGPGRSPFAALRAGTAKTDRPSRARCSRASMSRIWRACSLASIAPAAPGAVYNVCDDEPAAPAAVVAHAAELLGLPPPPLVPLADRRAVADGAELLRRQQAGRETR